MTYMGTIKGNKIEFHERLPFTEGLQVVVEIIPDVPHKGSPQAWLTFLAGTLNEKEAELILKGAQECRQIDWEIWKEVEK
jgi:hypothetical protein